ncbi:MULTISPECIES: Pls/PosA family non-ribosomal peptide synthetase [unclassified Streptomyces]|uniref:Pls/PosA family non-ribosomal peptide synthetase n=1 Tax=unclassified Streptomyces TaxID=2593676 RepID=UPI000DB90BD2|nr:Pls/PosA family non-ribosomal peptide synthetase [Streptomyces sp. PsTaAH-137]MYT73910.1 peptide synthetase [Streptomyces sp. SID8367]RAJ89324.1 non-ribosomal peptide synthetase-like protein [Streptomyces sp. PsTaAH-137]
MANGTERVLAEVLAGVVRQDHVPPDSHFFDDLCANSLVMAHFCARVRKRTDLPSVSMRDVYGHPTIRSLAAALDAAPAVAPARAAAPEPPPPPGNNRRHVLCGVLQFLVFAGYCALAGFVTAHGYAWISGASGVVDVYLRALVFGVTLFAAACVLPVVAKWLLVGRWRATEFPVWSLAYVRLWTVKVLLHTNPLMLFVGNPLYVFYLRLLGARIGPGVTILSRAVPVCTDLVTIGAGTVLRKEATFLGYRAQAGMIRTGPVTIGRDVYVGEKTVLDIGTSMGDGSQLGHASALYDGAAVPAGERWHGSPARRTDVDYVRVPPARTSAARRIGYALGALLPALLLWTPLALGGTYLLLTEVPALGSLLAPETEDLTSPAFYAEALGLSVVGFAAFLLCGFAGVALVPRALGPLLREGRVYPLYGFHYSVQRAIARMTNVKFFKWLCGDSSYITGYLKAIGYDLSKVEQTGSNFGTEVQHETPYLATVGSGTMVADGLSVINADFSATSFKVSRTTIGDHNFLGNHIVYPSGARTGANCLLATKVLVPLDGPVREGVGLLGSPAFEIPRSVERDSRFDHLREGEELRRRLAAKNRSNLGTMGLFLALRWLHWLVISLIALVAFDLYDTYGGAAALFVGAAMLLGLVFSTSYYVFIERVICRFRPLEPQLCSIYDPYFWWHERLWKTPDNHLAIFNGTPFKALVWRALGVRIGRRVFDDGAYITERTLVTIGDDCTLGTHSKVQAHSQEDGTFKSDHIVIGAGCTLGTGALVHYGVEMGDAAVLAPDSFLMKGEQMPPGAHWGGNPAVGR